MIEAVLFDLDGTLLNTLDDIADCANAALSMNGLPVHDTEAYKYFVGSGADALIRRIVPGETVSAEVLEMVRKNYAELSAKHATDKTRPYDGVHELLEALKARALKSAVISNKPDAATQGIVAHFFGEGRFDFVIGNRPGIPLKPDPAIVLLVTDAIGVPPERCMYVGDTGTDMTTAKNSGCVPVGVTWGFRKRDELLSCGAEFLIGSPEELLALL
ncbi:MAG: HAD family hydrolase [Synergistaceae bacterium]|nr:HAD family hydrolase [Synergistaceae bacterium]